ncbi:MAG: DUF3298 domain-containing protein [Bacteroidales bacterium]|nr:DUF3298 domain-containing protein [Bacteroidales bacterium]
MKKTAIIMAVLAVTGLMSSCNRCNKDPKPVETDTVAEDTVVAEPEIQYDTLRYSQNPKKAPSLTLNYSIVLPIEDEAIPVTKVLRSNIITDILGEEYAKMEANEAFKKYIKNEQDAFENSINDIREGEDAELLEEDAYMYKFDRLISTTIKTTENLMVVDELFSSYDGGAHGYGGDVFYNYDLKSGKRLKLEDVMMLDKGAQSQLSELLYKKLMELSESEGQYNGMEIWDSSATDNYYIENGEMVFVYLPYAVAAYCYGVVYVPLKYKDIETLLIPGTAVEKELSDYVMNLAEKK